MFWFWGQGLTLLCYIAITNSNTKFVRIFYTKLNFCNYKMQASSKPTSSWKAKIHSFEYCLKANCMNSKTCRNHLSLNEQKALAQMSPRLAGQNNSRGLFRLTGKLPLRPNPFRPMPFRPTPLGPIPNLANSHLGQCHLGPNPFPPMPFRPKPISANAI